MMFVRLLDNQDVSAICATVSRIEYTTQRCTADDIRHASLPGASAWGSTILELDVLCEGTLEHQQLLSKQRQQALPTPAPPSCSAHLFSSDDSLFSQCLRIIALRVSPINFYFLQELRICGLDMRSLSHLLTEKAILGFADMPTKCGNGVLDNSEQCDDGNFDDKDGCYGCKIDTFYACMGAWRHSTAPHELGFLPILA